MKPKYKIDSWIHTDNGVFQVKGIHINRYADSAEEQDSVQYEVWNDETWVDEDEVHCEMVPKK